MHPCFGTTLSTQQLESSNNSLLTFPPGTRALVLRTELPLINTHNLASLTWLRSCLPPALQPAHQLTDRRGQWCQHTATGSGAQHSTARSKKTTVMFVSGKCHSSKTVLCCGTSAAAIGLGETACMKVEGKQRAQAAGARQLLTCALPRVSHSLVAVTIPGARATGTVPCCCFPTLLHYHCST
jgi:hypothetical protein